MRVDGVVLAGGRSSRMQMLTHNKAWLVWRGQPLVAYSMDALRPLVQQLWISANSDIAEFSAYATVLKDASNFPAYQGPLVGIYSALQRSDAEYLLCVPVDSPLVTNAILQRLLDHARQNPQVSAVYARAARSHPLVVVLRVDQKISLKRYLDAGHQRVHGWLAQIDAEAVHFSESEEALFMNVNTPADLLQLPA